MKEYTLLALCSVLAVWWLEIRCRTGVFRRKEFYWFLAAMGMIKLLVNGYLTGAQVVRYDPAFYMGVRAGTIPLEDFVFGFSMVTATIVLWESKLRRSAGRGGR
jgi:lycopene cyclase domain-containing protein